jgi:hypothetical protein
MNIQEVKTWSDLKKAVGLPANEEKPEKSANLFAALKKPNPPTPPYGANQTQQQSAKNSQNQDSGGNSESKPENSNQPLKN